MTHNIFTEVLSQGYEEMFDLYISDDVSNLQDKIYFKDTHPQLPLIRIIDPAKRVFIEKIKSAKSFLTTDLTKNENVSQVSSQESYPFTQDIMFMPGHHDPQKLKDQIEQFLDGVNKNGDSLPHYYQSEKFKPHILSKIVCAANFEEKVLKDPSFEHCIVEVFGDHCGGCQAAAVMMAALTHKMKKYGYLSEMPLF